MTWPPTRDVTLIAEGNPERAGEEARTSWATILLAWSIPSAIGALQAVTGYAVRNRLADEWPWALQRGIKLFCWAALTPAIFYAGRRFPMRRGKLLRHGATHFGIAMTIAAGYEFLWSGLNSQLYAMMNSVAAPEVIGLNQVVQLSGNLVGDGFIYVAVLAVGATIDRDRQLHEQHALRATLEAQLAQAQVQALKMLVHPHFLFNAFHAVTVLIESAPTLATRMIVRLGDLLRLSLSRASSAEVEVERELEMLRLYLEIEQIRFRDRLVVRYEIDPATLPALVPDLILQPLVENAIKHGIGAHADQGTIVIRSRREGSQLILEIENDGRRLPDAEPLLEGIGLTTTRARLAALYGADQELVLRTGSEGRTIARLGLPYRVGAAGVDFPAGLAPSRSSDRDA